MSTLTNFPRCARPFSYAINKKASHIFKTFPRCARALLLKQSIRKWSIHWKSFRAARGRLCQGKTEDKRKRRVHHCSKAKRTKNRSGEYRMFWNDLHGGRSWGIDRMSKHKLMWPLIFVWTWFELCTLCSALRAPFCLRNPYANEVHIETFCGCTNYVVSLVPSC